MALGPLVSRLTRSGRRPNDAQNYLIWERTRP
jgi:hypothetical protein